MPVSYTHLAKVVEYDDSLREEPVLTNEDLVLGIRPEFLDIVDDSCLEGEIYGAMPTGMESTLSLIHIWSEAISPDTSLPCSRW